MTCILCCVQDPKDTPPPTRVETKEEKKKERKVNLCYYIPNIPVHYQMLNLHVRFVAQRYCFGLSIVEHSNWMYLYNWPSAAKPTNNWNISSGQ